MTTAKKRLKGSAARPLDGGSSAEAAHAAGTKRTSASEGIDGPIHRQQGASKALARGSSVRAIPNAASGAGSSEQNLSCVGFDHSEASPHHGKREPHQADAEREIAWYDFTLGAKQWLAHRSVTPQQAAMLLCGFNPNEDRLEDALQSSSEETAPEDMRALLAAFEDLQRADTTTRSLLDWAAVAKGRVLKMHTWLDKYLQASDGGMPDHKRRLYLLRQLGGDVTRQARSLRISGIGLLVQQEKDAGRERSDPKTIRADLIRAAEEEQESKRAGAADSGGTPSLFPAWHPPGR
jgi:hypothetical protein